MQRWHREEDGERGSEREEKKTELDRNVREMEKDNGDSGQYMLSTYVTLSKNKFN